MLASQLQLASWLFFIRTDLPSTLQFHSNSPRLPSLYPGIHKYEILVLESSFKMQLSGGSEFSGKSCGAPLDNIWAGKQEAFEPLRKSLEKQ